MLRYCILGSGLMGKAIAYDLLQQEDTDYVLLVDNEDSKLHEAKEFLSNDSKLKTLKLNISDETQLSKMLSGINSTVAAISYKFNEHLTKIAIQTKTNLCDLGGNNNVVSKQLCLNQDAKEVGISVIPDCGLAPGMVSVLVKHGLEKYNWARTVKIRVGGLPVNPINELKYEKLFSVDGLVNEYVEPVKVIRNGKVETVEPLIELEKIEFPEFQSAETLHATSQHATSQHATSQHATSQHATSLEAFTTSGGVSTLVETYKGKLQNLDYKTIRYQGHCEKLHELRKKGLFTKEYFERELPVCKDDLTLVKIIFEGEGNNHELVIIDRATKEPHITSMMRMTAFPASIIAQIQARKQISVYGVCPQEITIPSDIFINELKKRNIIIRGL